MEFKNGIAIPGDIQITTLQDALDLMADLSYNHDCYQVILKEDQLPDGFFDLSTRIAGEILQKYSNYGLRIAIVGDFDKYDSNSLNDFIRESNKSRHVYFAGSQDEAIEALSK